MHLQHIVKLYIIAVSRITTVKAGKCCNREIIALPSVTRRHCRSALPELHLLLEISDQRVTQQLQLLDLLLGGRARLVHLRILWKLFSDTSN